MKRVKIAQTKVSKGNKVYTSWSVYRRGGLFSLFKWTKVGEYGSYSLAKKVKADILSGRFYA